MIIGDKSDKKIWEMSYCEQSSLQVFSDYYSKINVRQESYKIYGT